MAVPSQGAYRPFGALAPEKVRSTLTGREGKAKLESLPAGAVERHRPRAGLRHAAAAGGSPRARSRCGSRRAASSPASCARGEGSRPVAGARVSVRRRLARARRLGGGSDTQRDHDRRAGPLPLDGIGRAPVTLVARAPGFGRGGGETCERARRVELFLFPGATLAGVVRDDAGSSGDRARWCGPKATGPGRSAAERTDARGEFRMAGVRPGEYTVVAREGGRAPGIAAVVVEPEAEATTSLDPLSDGGFVTGRIVDPEGRPLAGRLRVEVFDEHGLPSSASDAWPRTRRPTARSPSVRFRSARSGIAVSAPRHATRRVEATIAARGRTVDLGDVALETGLVDPRPGTRPRGQRDRRAPRCARRLRASGRARARAKPRARRTARSSSRGSGPGTYDVSRRAVRATPRRTRRPRRRRALDLVLEPGGEIAGRVVDADGQPVEEAHRHRRKDASEPRRARAALRRAGRRRRRSVRAARRRGRDATCSQVRRRRPGRSVDRGRAGCRGPDDRRSAPITLGRGGIVRGVVVDADGQGIPGATVIAERDAEPQSERPGRDQTGSPRAFEIRGVPVGPA